MYVKKLKAGSVNTSVDRFVGERGTLFYDFDNGILRISDGHTPGGHLVYNAGSSLPTGGDAGQVLTTDGSNNLYWSDVVSGNIFDQTLNTTSSVSFHDVTIVYGNIAQINGINPGGELSLNINGNVWNFNGDGSLAFPDGTTQTTAFTGGIVPGAVTTATVNELIGSSLTNYTSTVNDLIANSLTNYATQSYVTTQVNNLINGAPGALDTLGELAAALQNQESTVTALISLIGTKASLSSFSVTTGTSTGSGALSYNTSTGVFTFNPANLSAYATNASLANYTTQSYVISYVTGFGYTNTATVNALIASSLTNYATQGYVTSRGYITTASANTLIANSLTNYATQNYVNAQISATGLQSVLDAGSTAKTSNVTLTGQDNALNTWLVKVQGGLNTGTSTYGDQIVLGVSSNIGANELGSFNHTLDAWAPLKITATSLDLKVDNVHYQFSSSTFYLPGEVLANTSNALSLHSDTGADIAYLPSMPGGGWSHGEVTRADTVYDNAGAEIEVRGYNAYTSSEKVNTWKFSPTGTFELPSVSLTTSTNRVEQQTIVGSRKVINGNPSTTYASGGSTATVWRSAHPAVVGAKVFVRVQSDMNVRTEMFNISIVKDSSRVVWTLSDYIKSDPTYPDSTIYAGVDVDGYLEIYHRDNNGWGNNYTYDATEFIGTF